MPAKKQSSDTDIKFSLRIPKEIHEWLEKKADSEFRSINAYLLIMLRKAKDEDERRLSTSATDHITLAESVSVKIDPPG